MPKHAATVWPGQPYPLGATWDGEGVNFALFSGAQQEHELLAFVRELIRLRKHHPVFHRRCFFEGRIVNDSAAKDLTWLASAGLEMTGDDWRRPNLRNLGLLFAGDGFIEEDPRGRSIRDDNLLLLLNAGAQEIAFSIPRTPPYARWQVLVDTAFPGGHRGDGRNFHSGERYPRQARSMSLLGQMKSQSPGFFFA